MSKRMAIAAGMVAVTLIGAGLWTTYATPIVFCAFLQDDIMDKAFCGTVSRLDNYDEDPDEAVRWLLAYHGEAPSTSVMLTLVDWSLEEPDNFVDLLDRVDHENVDSLVDRMAFAARQGNHVDRFANMFRSRTEESERLGFLLKEMEK